MESQQGPARMARRARSSKHTRASIASRQGFDNVRAPYCALEMVKAVVSPDSVGGNTADARKRKQ